MRSKLTEKQKFFCREYLRDFNATQAAVRAGYSKKTAKQIAAENLSKLDLRRYIRELADDLNVQTDNDIKRIIVELQLIAFGSLKDVADWDSNGIILKDSEHIEESARLVSELSDSPKFGMKIKMHDKLKALELLGKYHKIFSDKEDEDSKNRSEITINLAYDRRSPIEVE